MVGVEPARVFAVLADGWSYPLWVVGATHMRKVDPQWPAVGARLHHSIGVWPLALEDKTEVEEVEPARRLVLRAYGGFLGNARVEIELEPVAGGTRVRMSERMLHVEDWAEIRRLHLAEGMPIKVIATPTGAQRAGPHRRGDPVRSGDGATACAVLSALGGLPCALRNHRVVPEQAEAGLRLLREPQRRSVARRYVG